MRSGAWLQFGDRSQRSALEQLDAGAGVGVIISPRDLAPGVASRYTPQYRERGAAVLVDPQFYVPESRVGRLPEWGGIDTVRASITALNELTSRDLEPLTNELRVMNSDVGVDGVIAPAVVHEAGRPEIVDLNRRLFEAAKVVAEDLEVPAYGTVVIGRSATSSDRTFFDALSAGSSVSADGWYHSVEFSPGRVPERQDEALRFLRGVLALAGTGKPVLQAFAGPMAILGVAAGATGVGIGHSQNLWQFPRARWVPTSGGGGGGDAPARLFSDNLWGTVVYPDELAVLPSDLAEALVCTSPFAPNVSASAPYPPLARWDAGKHLVWTICRVAEGILAEDGLTDRTDQAQAVLETAVGLIGDIAGAHHRLRDDTDAYQRPWLNALVQAREEHGDDFDFVEMLG